MRVVAAMIDAGALDRDRYLCRDCAAVVRGRDLRVTGNEQNGFALICSGCGGVRIVYVCDFAACGLPAVQLHWGGTDEPRPLFFCERHAAMAGNKSAGKAGGI